MRRATDQRDLVWFAFSNDEHRLSRVPSLLEEEAYRAASQYHCTLRAQYGFTARPNPPPPITLAMPRRLILPVVDEQVLAGTMQLQNRASQRLGRLKLALEEPRCLYPSADRSAFAQVYSLHSVRSRIPFAAQFPKYPRQVDRHTLAGYDWRGLRGGNEANMGRACRAAGKAVTRMHIGATLP